SGTQIPSTAFNNRFLFTGREYAATFQGNYVPWFKFYEYRARAYNPQLGRFMSEDPKGFNAGDYNLFRYCHNDPIDFTDPLGLEFIDQGEVSWSMIGGASAGGVYGYTQPHLEWGEGNVTLTRVAGGVQVHVKDFNYVTKSHVTHRADVFQKGQRIIFNREQKNIERTSRHEGEHRHKERQEYNRVHDQVLKDLNSNEVYKDSKAAMDALGKKLSDAFRDFNYNDHNHLEPVWHNYKPPALEQPPDTTAQERASNLIHSKPDPNSP